MIKHSTNWRLLYLLLQLLQMLYMCVCRLHGSGLCANWPCNYYNNYNYNYYSDSRCTVSAGEPHISLSQTTHDRHCNHSEWRRPTRCRSVRAESYHKLFVWSQHWLYKCAATRQVSMYRWNLRWRNKNQLLINYSTWCKLLVMNIDMPKNRLFFDILQWFQRLLKYISQLPNLFTGKPRICNFILLLIAWVCFLARCYLLWNLRNIRCSFSLFSTKNAKILQLKSNPNPNPNFQSGLVR